VDVRVGRGVCVRVYVAVRDDVALAVRLALCVGRWVGGTKEDVGVTLLVEVGCGVEVLMIATRVASCCVGDGIDVGVLSGLGTTSHALTPNRKTSRKIKVFRPNINFYAPPFVMLYITYFMR